jgi:hypothetical protein
MNAQPEIIPEDESIEAQREIAVFGREVELFIETDRIGQFLVRQARLHVEEAQEALLTVDPDDVKKVRELQFKARVAGAVMGWLKQAINDGDNATRTLQQERDSR